MVTLYLIIIQFPEENDRGIILSQSYVLARGLNNII